MSQANHFLFCLETGSPVAQAALKLTKSVMMIILILLRLVPKFWDYGHVPPHPICVVREIKRRGLGVLALCQLSYTLYPANPLFFCRTIIAGV